MGRADSGWSKLVYPQKLVGSLCIAGAVVSAYNVGDYISWTGIIYYFVCLLALIRDHPRVKLLLWGAVAAHAALVGYSIWRWLYLGIEPCPYCFASAGLMLVAATAQTKLPAAILPAMLIIVAAYAWPSLFAPRYDIPYTQPVYKAPVTPAESQPAPTAATTSPEPENNTGKKPVESVKTKPPGNNDNVQKTEPKSNTFSGAADNTDNSVEETGAPEPGGTNSGAAAKPESG